MTVILISATLLLLFGLFPLCSLVAVRTILELEEPVCLFAETARKGGSWCPPCTARLGVRGTPRNRVGWDTQKRGSRLNLWLLEEETSTQGSWPRTEEWPTLEEA